MPISTATPVYTKTKNATAYLEVVPVGSRVRVQRTDAGRTLNRFWTVWLRMLLLEKTDPKHGFSIELGDQSVMIAANLSAQGLIETIRSIATEIVPIPKPPMQRRDDATSRNRMFWFGTDESLHMSECWKMLQLPGKAKMDGDSYLMLERDRKNVFTIGQLGMMVELHAALHYRNRS